MTPNILRYFSVAACPGYTTIEVPQHAYFMVATVEDEQIRLHARVPEASVHHLTCKREVAVVEPWCKEPRGTYLSTVVARGLYEESLRSLHVYLVDQAEPLKRTEPTAEEVLAELRKIDGEDGFLEPMVQWLNQGPRKQRTLGEVLVTLATHRARSALP